jgi:hypothetical protein
MKLDAADTTVRGVLLHKNDPTANIQIKYLLSLMYVT